MNIKYGFSQLVAAADIRSLGARLKINQQCRGYSSACHWRYFRSVVQHHKPKSICVLGVYYGRDIAYLSHFMHQLWGRPAAADASWKIVGVDKFEDKFCDDWPEELRQKNWQDAGFGPAPKMENAQENLRALQLDGNVKLVAAKGEDFLASTTDSFDFIYVDTSHDYDCTLNTIRLALKHLKPGGVIGGDDYLDSETWGVRKAVTEAFTQHEVSGSWIWLANASDVRTAK
jgi:SAM-dependent methyltransferase